MAIPLPGQPGQAFLQGTEGGSNLMNRILQNNMQREQLAMNQQLFPLQQQMLEANTKKALADAQLAQYKSNPAQAMEQMMQILNQGMMTQGQQPSIYPESMEGAPLYPQSPQQSAIPQGQPYQPGTGVNDAVLGQIMKATFGVDPFAETAQQKRAKDLEQFKEKEEYKLNLPKENLTQANQTSLQNVVIGSNNLLPKLERLMEAEAPWHFGSVTLSPNLLANHEALVSSAIEDYMSAYNLKNNAENTKKTEAILERRPGEKMSNYRARLRDIYEEVQKRSQSAQDTLEERKTRPMGENSESGGNRVRKRFNPVTGVFE